MTVDRGTYRVDPALIHFRDRLSVPWTYQVTRDGGGNFVENGVRPLPGSSFLAGLA